MLISYRAFGWGRRRARSVAAMAPSLGRGLAAPWLHASCVRARGGTPHAPRRRLPGSGRGDHRGRCAGTGITSRPVRWRRTTVARTASVLQCTYQRGQTGLDCARWRRLWRSAARRCVLDDRGAVGVRDTPSNRALRAPRSRRQARVGGRPALAV